MLRRLKVCLYNLMESVSKHIKDKKVTGSVQHGFGDD